MITSKENLFHFLRSNKAPYWMLFPESGIENPRICDNMDNANMEESITKLDNILDALGNNGRYVFVARTNNEAKNLKNGNFEIKFQLHKAKNHANNSSDLGGPIAQSPIDIEKEIDRRINERMATIELQNQVRDLQDKLKQKGNSNTLDRFVEILKPYMGEIIASLTPAKGVTPAIGQHTEIIREEMSSEPAPEQSDLSDEERLSTAIRTIMQIANHQNKDGIDLFERLANKLTDQPDMLDDIEMIL